MTQFRAVRNFLRSPGVDVREGELLELDDAEARLLVMLQAVEPLHAKDRARVRVTPNITWEAPPEEPEREPLRLVGTLGARR